MLRREVYKPGEPHGKPALVDTALVLVVLFCALRLIAAVLVLAFAACDVEQDLKGAGADIAEVSYCEVADCGEVFQCDMPDGSTPEWCYPTDDAAALAADSGADRCYPTPRGGALGWPCLWHCDGGRGCNAYSGCYGCGD